MAWYCPAKYKTKSWVNVNEKLKELRGELDDKQARLTLMDFLYCNIGLTVELLSGVKLAPYQEITLKGMLRRQRSMCVWGRGCAKSFIAAIYCFLECIFEPKSKIMLAGPTFRTSRNIFSTYLEKIVRSPGAELLQQAFSAPPSKRNDLFEWRINDGSISAIPLNGEYVRGFRANKLVIDEYLLMPQKIIEDVLKPFLSSPLDVDERIKIREIEDKYIAEGRLREDQRMKFENNSKMIALSSASYTFENLYTTYKDWKEKIYGEGEDKEGCKYFICQLSYEAIPAHMIDQSVTEEAKNGGSSKASFQREYCAQFVDESDGYFSAKKMNECTYKEGTEPTTLISGRPGKKYILAIDPNYASSKRADFFAMAVLELDDEHKDGTLVHGYSVAGADLKKHIRYLYYLLSNFDIEMIIIDNADFAFIDAANESALFASKGKHIGFIDIDTTLEGAEYEAVLREFRTKYNKKEMKYCFKQQFTVEFLRRANQHLQYCIDYKKIWFASNIRCHGPAFERAVNTPINMDLIPFEDIGDFAEFQDDLVYQTKKQCALIELTTSPKGVQSFDLPHHLKNDNSEKRARKDNYTALLLGNWAVKVYYDMQEVKPMQAATFTPFFAK